MMVLRFFGVVVEKLWLYLANTYIEGFSTSLDNKNMLQASGGIKWYICGPYYTSVWINSK